MNGGVRNEKHFLKNLKQRLIDCFLQGWYSNNTSSLRYRPYSTFIREWKLEQYLDFLDIRKFRGQFVRFRCGVTELRATNIHRNNLDVLCPFCKVTEDEAHFLLICQTYSVLRERYLAQFTRDRSNIDVCAYLLQGKGQRKTRSVAMFIYYALKIRNEKIVTMESNST